MLQKLPVLANTNKSTSSSRVNLPGDAGSRGGLLSSEDVGGAGGGGGGGPGGFPILNNNRGELTNDSPTNRRSSNRNNTAETNGHAQVLTPQGGCNYLLVNIVGFSPERV